MKYLSLFSGIGGFELGIGGRGECIGFSEIDKYATQVYKKHFNHKEYGDITKISTESIPDFDLLVGGLPCQAFSIAGKRGGFSDTRGTLFFEIARILRDKRPRNFLLENVKGLLSHDGGKTFQTIIKVLTDLGYGVEWQVLNSKNFGVPQNRERVFIIGHLGGFSGKKVFPIGQDGEESYKGKPRRMEVQTAHCLNARMHKMGRDDNYIKQLNIPTHSNDRVYSDEGLSPTLNTMQGGNRQPFVAIPVLTPDRVNKRQNGRRMKEDGDPSFTLTAQDKHGIYDGARIRRLTPTECERLQGFPDVEKKCILELCKQVNANGVEWTLNTKSIDLDNAVQSDVLIDCVENGVEIRNQEKLFLNAKNVEKKNWCHPHIKIDDFVQMLVGINIIVEKGIKLGEVELHQNEECLTPQKNGKRQENKFGNEIMQPVGTAKNDLTTLKELLKFIISDHSDTKNLEQKLVTLSSFVIRAIIGFIPKKILNQDTFTIEVRTKVGWTYGVSDTQRYKCLGNAVTVNVIEAITTTLLTQND